MTETKDPAPLTALREQIDSWLHWVTPARRVKMLAWPVPNNTDGESQFDYDHTGDDSYKNIFETREDQDFSQLLNVVRLRYADHENAVVRRLAVKNVMDMIAELKALQKINHNFSIVYYETSWWRKGFDTHVYLLDECFHNKVEIDDDVITFALFVAPRVIPKSDLALSIERYLEDCDTARLLALRSMLPVNRNGYDIDVIKKADFRSDFDGHVDLRGMFSRLEERHANFQMLVMLDWGDRGNGELRIRRRDEVLQKLHELRGLQENKMQSFSIVLHVTFDKGDTIELHRCIMDLGVEKHRTDLGEAVTFHLCIAPRWLGHNATAE